MASRFDVRSSVWQGWRLVRGEERDKRGIVTDRIEILVVGYLLYIEDALSKGPPTQRINARRDFRIERMGASYIEQSLRDLLMQCWYFALTKAPHDFLVSNDCIGSPIQRPKRHALVEQPYRCLLP
jgi:hypothetical protein